MSLETVSSPKPESKSLIKVAKVETKSGNFDILYNNHRVGSLPGESVKDADGIVLELVHEHNTEQKVRNLVKIASMPGLLYNEIIAEAAKATKPVFFVDLPLELARDPNMILKEVIVPVLEASLGYKITVNAVQRLSKKFNRRELLKGIGWLAVATYLLIPITKAAGKAMLLVNSQSEITQTATRTSSEFSDALHPELRSNISVRNALIAQKSEFIASQIKTEGRKPKIAIAIGLAHWGIEKSLGESSEQRVKEVHDGLGERTVEQSLIAKIDFLPEGIKVTFLRDPALAGKR